MTDLPTQTGAPVGCSECDRSETIRIRVSEDGSSVEIVCVSCGARETFGVWKGAPTEISSENTEQEEA